MCELISAEEACRLLTIERVYMVDEAAQADLFVSIKKDGEEFNLYLKMW